MMAGAAAAVVDAYLRRRRRIWERTAREPIAVQEGILRRLITRAGATEFGREHGFDSIRSVADYQSRVPLRDYVAMKPRLDWALQGAPDVVWPGRARHWVKTSGTTAGEKVLPVTEEAFASHRLGGWDALLMAAERVGGRRLLGGPMLFLSGCATLTPIGRGGLCGDLSGLIVHRLPPLLRGHYSPGPAVRPSRTGRHGWPPSRPGWPTRICVC